MTAKSDFTDEEWKLVLEGPPTAGLIVLTAASGGSFRESWALAKTLAEARKQHGESELLDAIVAEKPEVDRGRYHSAEELREHGLAHLREAAELLGRKATPQEVEDYRAFALELATKVAAAHKEKGERVSPPEQEAIDAVAASLGAEAPQAST